MVNKDSVSQVVKYVHTPQHVIAVVVLALMSILLWAELPEVATYILIGLFVVVVSTYLILLVCNPKTLTFSAQGHITFARERLGDNSMNGLTYVAGERESSEVPRITDDDGVDN